MLIHCHPHEVFSLPTSNLPTASEKLQQTISLFTIALHYKVNGMLLLHLSNVSLLFCASLDNLEHYIYLSANPIQIYPMLKMFSTYRQVHINRTIILVSYIPQLPL